MTTGKALSEEMRHIPQDAQKVADSILDETAKILRTPSVTLEDDLAALHANSLVVLQLMSAVEERFDTSIDMVDMFRIRTVRDLVELVEASMMRS
ncbi:acyl carrier protein [Streptomyces sp. NPDC014734]|uniref:acyl carrier protein n=1 Tax=Streptomyces sp. NPDC014734 TaxID=3364886 RepID=UPI0036FAD6F4